MSTIDYEAVREQAGALSASIAQLVLGQDEVVAQLLRCTLAGGHALLEGLPGSGKTLAVHAMARSLGCSFRRIQFTPDLMPSDVVGTQIWNPGEGRFELRLGPVFTDILLADEINRTPPKTQAALLEAMEERQVSLDGEPRPLDPIFTVFATQNPIEFEGTYPLPEAQLDRFMMKITVPQATAETEIAVYERYGQGADAHTRAGNTSPVMGKQAMLDVRAAVRELSCERGILEYIRLIMQGTRTHPELFVGAGIRAGLHLLAVAKAAAVMAGRDYVSPDEVKQNALPVLRHRVILHPDAQVDGVHTDDVLREIVNSIPVPR